MVVVEDHLVQLFKQGHEFAVRMEGAPEHGQLRRSGDRPDRCAHGFPGNMDAAVVERPAVQLLAGVGVPGIEEQQVARFHLEGFSGAEQLAPPADDAADHIVVVEVERKTVHDFPEGADIELQLRVALDGSGFTAHENFPFARIIYHRAGGMSCTILQGSKKAGNP